MLVLLVLEFLTTSDSSCIILHRINQTTALPLTGLSISQHESCPIDLSSPHSKRGTNEMSFYQTFTATSKNGPVMSSIDIQ